MNKKILVVSILAVFMLITISFASTVSSNTETKVEKKESPLYKIRTNRAIGKNLGTIIDYIKTKFFGDRIFFIPLQNIYITILKPMITLFEQPSERYGCCPATTQPTCFAVRTCQWYCDK